MLRKYTLLLALLLPGTAGAHSFGIVYTLPIPFWLYAWGASAALVASFLVVAYFATQAPAQAAATAPAYPHRIPKPLLRVLQGLSLGSLLLCIATGWFGTPNPYGNFNMSFFWIGIVLGYAYLAALIGDWFALLNPWRLLSAWLPETGRWRYPQRLAFWPALLLYLGFIAYELFGASSPRSLAHALAAYTLINLAGVWAWGRRDWFRYGEFFSVWLGLVARLAPIELAQDAEGRASGRFRWRAPLSGLSQPLPAQWSLLLFLLFMLASTAFDGLHESQPWMQLYWVDLYRAVFAHWLGSNPLAAYPQMREIFQLWQLGWLWLSPFIYLGVYLLGIAALRALAGGGSLRELALRYAPSLLPIVLVYHITHYYTLIETQGVRLVALVSDPFGWGWNLFGTRDWLRGAIVPDMNIVWHVQVGLILAGHIASVYVAHLEALRHYGEPRRATLSQLPMLLLMVLFTAAGLWILSLPLSKPW